MGQERGSLRCATSCLSLDDIGLLFVRGYDRGKIRICTVFCCQGYYGNMERNIARKVVHRTWLGITKLSKVEQTPYFVL